MDSQATKLAIKICDSLGLHIKELREGDLPDVHKLPLDNTYIMKGDTVLYVGSINDCVSFILSMARKSFGGIQAK